MFIRFYRLLNRPENNACCFASVDILLLLFKKRLHITLNRLILNEHTGCQSEIQLPISFIRNVFSTILR